MIYCYQYFSIHLTVVYFNRLKHTDKYQDLKRRLIKLRQQNSRNCYIRAAILEAEGDFSRGRGLQAWFRKSLF